ERFEPELGTELDLRKFPFDPQTLVMGVESFRYNSSAVQFVLQQGHNLKSPIAFLPDWNILDVKQRLSEGRVNPNQETYSHYVLEIDVRRKVGFYVWNVFLPLAFIALLPWTVFWIDIEDVRT